MKNFGKLALCIAVLAVIGMVPAYAQEESEQRGEHQGEHRGEHRRGDHKMVDLLASQDLADWDFFLVDSEVAKEDVWSFNDDGVLVCKGTPMGYLCTKAQYTNFALIVEWRWPSDPGNSGVLMRISGEPCKLPHCVEGQLQNGSAGDFWAFHDFMIDGEGVTVREGGDNGVIRGIKKTEAAENEPGEWNKYVIVARDGEITLRINGTVVNQTTDAQTTPGAIGFQSEGGEIHFRTIRLITFEDDEDGDDDDDDDEEHEE